MTDRTSSRADTRIDRTTLHGVWPAVIVPWTADDHVDERRLAEEVRAYGDTGIHGLYTGGTTGEFYAQDDQAFERITAIVCAEGHALGLPVQIGCTALSTRTVVRRVRTAIAAGADGIQLALPFWLPVTDEELLSFFEAVAARAPEMPLILYQTARATRRLAPSLIGRLAAHVPTLLGMKDTGCDVDGLRQVLDAAPGLAMFGAEHDLPAKIQAGGRGTCSAITGLAPRRIAALYEHCRAGRLDRARPIAEQLARYQQELLAPMVEQEGLWDSAVDRVQRVAGGVDVGLRCQGPYRSPTMAHVDRLRGWCARHAPELLEESARR